MAIQMASLHNHTYNSLLDAVMSPDELVQQAYDLGYSAIAVTEHGNMYSFIDAYKKSKELGIKFIPGCEVYETTDMDYKEKDADRYHLILLAKSEKGLKNLFKIVTESNTRGFYGKPRVDLKLLARYSEDIICMSSCLGGRINRIMGTRLASGSQFDLAQEWVNKYKEVFGDNFYLEMQSHSTTEQHAANRNLVILGRETDTKLTITFDTHLRDSSELQRNVHALFIQTSQDRDEQDFTSIVDTYEGCWQQTIEEIHQTMDKQVGEAIVSQAIKNTFEIGEMCNVEIPLNQDLMPHVKIPKTFKSELEYLKQLINEGWIRRGGNLFSGETARIYKERLRLELEVIDYLGYNGYFLMLSQLFQKFRERKIPLGYGRGSAGGCLILYMLGVTEVDSIRFDLDFSRFANKGRKGSPADVDIDISQRRRGEALEIAAELFGADHICQVATFNSMSPKVAIRDLGKALDEQGVYEIPYVIRDKISKLIPDDPNKKMTIERAMELNPELKKYAKQYPLLFEYTKYLQNVPKSVGCHAAAVLIAPSPIVEFCPLQYNKEGNLMSQLEMHNAMDDIGLVKMDFLGLKTLDVVDDTLRLSGMNWDNIDLRTLDLNDEDVMREIYGKGRTLGVFQMETVVPKQMFLDMMPNINVNDVFAVNAMNRPAILSVGMHNVYIKNKREPDHLSYIHEDLEPIFAETHGIMLYQEQALKAFALAGFDEADRDIARRAIGKKKKDVMDALYVRFADGLDKRGWTKDQILELWNLVEAQAGYSFNAAHSTAYGLLSYVTAYLKYHHPVEFMTALLISEIGNYDQITKYVNEAREMGIEVLPPDINKSDNVFTVFDRKILFGLLSIKGVGESALEEILSERSKGKFTDMRDVYIRVKPNITTMLALIKSGAFGISKSELLNEYAHMTSGLKKYKPVVSLPTKAKLFELGLIDDEKAKFNKDAMLEVYNEYRSKIHDKEMKDKLDRYMSEFRMKYMDDPTMYEFDTLSIFLSGNPFDAVHDYFKPYEDVKDGKKHMLGGTITKIQYKRQRKGGRMSICDVLTMYGIVECVFFATTYADYQDLIKRGQNVVILAKRNDESFIVSDMKLLQDWKEEKNIA